MKIISLSISSIEKDTGTVFSIVNNYTLSKTTSDKEHNTSTSTLPHKNYTSIKFEKPKVKLSPTYHIVRFKIFGRFQNIPVRRSTPIDAHNGNGDHKTNSIFSWEKNQSKKTPRTTEFGNLKSTTNNWRIKPLGRFTFSTIKKKKKENTRKLHNKLLKRVKTQVLMLWMR